MADKTIYRCRNCGKIIFHLYNDGSVKIKKGEQYITLKRPQRVDVICGRCGQKSTFYFNQGDNDA